MIKRVKKQTPPEPLKDLTQDLPSKVPQDLQGLRDLLAVVSKGKYMWQATFDAIQDPVMIIGRDYVVERANLATAERCDEDIRGIIGKKCYEVFAKRDSICPKCPLEETIKEGRGKSVEIAFSTANGDFEVNSYPMLYGQGSEGGRVVHHYRDVTEEKRLQRKLIQSEKMAAIGMLAGGVAHEINNPLAGILAFSQLLQKELSQSDRAHQDLREIEEAAKRCKKIVEDLLTFARPHGEGKRLLLSVQQEVEKILPLARLNLRHQHVTLATAYEAGLPPVMGNGPRLQQVFLNLINNAAYAQGAKGGGTISLKVGYSSDPHFVQVEVADTGCGIREEDLSKIFDPFFSTKEKNEGTGLGLSICYSIISEHGGKIEVESQEGKGSAFRVLLPVISVSQ